MITPIRKLLVVALGPEWSQLRRHHRFEKSAGSVLWLSSNLPYVALIQTGPGQRCQKALAEALESAGPESILHFGACGALTPASHAGEIILPETITDGKEELAPDAALYGRLLSALNGNTKAQARLFSSPVVLKKRQEKMAAHARTGAAYVDMESYAVAALCRQKGIRYVAARGVFDLLDEDLTALGEPYREDGELATGRLAVNILTHPRLIRELPSLRDKARRVEEGLLPVIEAYVREGEI